MSLYSTDKKSNTFFCICRFFHGNSGAFTLFEATPEVLKVFQIDEYGNEVYNTHLHPRTTIQSLNDAEDVLLDDFFTSQS